MAQPNVAAVSAQRGRGCKAQQGCRTQGDGVRPSAHRTASRAASPWRAPRTLMRRCAVHSCLGPSWQSARPRHTSGAAALWREAHIKGCTQRSGCRRCLAGQLQTQAAGFLQPLHARDPRHRCVPISIGCEGPTAQKDIRTGISAHCGICACLFCRSQSMLAGASQVN